VKQPNIRLHIEELVLHSFAPNDRYAIADAVERELSRLLAGQFGAQGLTASLSDHSTASRLDAGTFQVEQSSKPSAIGNQIAQAIHGGLTK
jgi:hypothetical protein